MNTTSTNAGSSLEILVPGAPETPVELNIRASDWDGRTLPSDCEILANGAAVPN